MLRFSEDGEVADRQMRAVIFYLTTFGYIDGDFDDSEKAFVRDYIGKLVAHRVSSAIDASETALRAELSEKYTRHFLEVFEEIDRQVKDLFTEAVSENESQDAFVHGKLKLRCFEIFKSFDEGNQHQLMDTIDMLIQADGQVHPAEVKFRSELAELLEEDLGVELLEDDSDTERGRVAVTKQVSRAMPQAVDHPYFGQFEHHYSRDPDALLEQVKADLSLLDSVSNQLAKMRMHGGGRLNGKQRVDQLAQEPAFLDGHVHVLPAATAKRHELTVLGDLHGCYSCLKAALRQSEFLEKVETYKRDPSAPRPALVLLGDYIDRGMFSYHGVLRTVMRLFVDAPEHVYVLRGNHEFYFEHKGTVYGGVKPAEAINTLRPHLPVQVFQRYMKLFDELPNMLFFDRFLFVHGGIPRDATLKAKYKDLSSLNDADLRFEMMWSDPSSADVIPAALQTKSARFPFGRLQSQAFLQRLGCHTLMRGHEKVEEGFRRTYDTPEQLLITLFSAGGKDNLDLPEDSSYRGVTPMALTLTLEEGRAHIEPWRIQYDWYQDSHRNHFRAAKAEIEHKAE